MSAGRIFLADSIPNAYLSDHQPRKLKNNKAFTLLEILTVVAIISITYVIYNNSTSITHYYYYHKSLLAQKKIIALLNHAKNIALISNKKVTVCPVKINTWQCTDNWHEPIILFYSGHNNIFSRDDIIMVNNPFINQHENITVHLFNAEKSISFDFKEAAKNLNGTIKYTNLYYNISINLNRIGRAK